MNAASLQFTNQLKNLLNVENIFKDTVDLRECTSENSFNGLFGVEPNFKTMKRM